VSQIAMETEDVARAAKETVFGTKSELFYKVCISRKFPSKPSASEDPRETIRRSVIDVVKKVTLPGNVKTPQAKSRN